VCVITIKFPYEPFLPANVTFPSAAAVTSVPYDAAISNPVCAELLILLLSPNLDVIIPETGLDNVIPKATFVLEIVVFVFTVPSFTVEALFFIVDFEVGAVYKLATASSTLLITFSSVSYFSAIVMLSIFPLFLAFS